MTACSLERVICAPTLRPTRMIASPLTVPSAPAGDAFRPQTETRWRNCGHGGVTGFRSGGDDQYVEARVVGTLEPSELTIFLLTS